MHFPFEVTGDHKDICIFMEMEWKNIFDANVHAFICVVVHRCMCMRLCASVLTVVESVIVCPCTNSLSVNSLYHISTPLAPAGLNL